MVPIVEMLWESDDPVAALRRRFGFDDAAEAGAWVRSALLEHWGVDGTCERPVISDGNALAWCEVADGRLLLKWSVRTEAFAVLAELARLTSWLDERGLPVSAPVPARDGRVQLEERGVSLALQRVVEGSHLDVTDGEAVREAGALLARLHLALAAYVPRDAGALPGPPPALRRRFGRWLDSEHVHAPQALVDDLGRALDGAPPDLSSTQVVHGDVRAANLLCQDGRVVAVLDFEEARHDHRVVDLARSAVLLGTLFHDWGPTSPEVRAAYVAGYRAEARRLGTALSADELGWFEVLVPLLTAVMVPPGEDPTGWAASAASLLAERG